MKQPRCFPYRSVLAQALTLLVAALALSVFAFADSTPASAEAENDRIEAAALARMDRLGADARRVVKQTLADFELRRICMAGVDRVKDSVKESVIALMFNGALASPRKAGTAAGRYIADRCREINPNY